MKAPFDYAHENWKKVVWMSQNTNQLVDHPEIRKSMKDAIDTGYYSLYPHQNGLPGLADAILEDLSLPKEDYTALVTNGGIEALYIFNRALIKPGQRMVASDPSFFPIHQQIQVGGGHMDEIGIYQHPYKLTLDKIEAELRPETRAVLLIDPINPLGTAYEPSEVEVIAKFCRDNDLLLMHDITYRDFSPNHVLASKWYPEGTVYAYSFSKTCGFAGMRLGALVAPKKLMEKMRPYNTNPLSGNIIAQVGAKKALETKREWLPEMLAQSMKNQNVVKEAVDEVEGAFIPVFPSRTNMLIIDISKTGLNPLVVQDRLLSEHDVFIRSGTYVSKRYGENFIRISFTVPPKGIKRFKDAFLDIMD